MSLSDKLSPEDRKAYAEAYGPLAKLRDAYVACGDQVNAKKIRQKISALSSFYQQRSKSETQMWLDEASQFTQDLWDKLGEFNKETRLIMWPHYSGKSTFFKQLYDKFSQPKEPQMLKITNSTDMPEYNTNGRACINLTHLLSKDQMLEVAKLAYQTYRDECLQAMGMKPIEYDQHRAIKQFKRGMALYPQVLHSFIEQHGYRKIAPYTLDVAQRQVAEAKRTWPYLFEQNNGLPERFYNHAVGHQAPDVAHFDKDAALKEAERIARRTNAEVRTYQLVSETTIEDVPTTTKQVVRRP